MRQRAGAVATVAVAALAVLGGLAGCSDDGGDDERSTASTSTAPATDPPSSDPTTSTSAATTTTGSDTSPAPATTATTEPPSDPPTASTSVPAVDEPDLPGERVDLYPYADAILAVVGVDRGDVLNVRTGPGTTFPVDHTLAPTARVRATGHTRRLASGAHWTEVVGDGRVGWANVAYLLQPGQVADVTSQLPDRPTGTLLELAQQVGAARASSDPPSRVVVVRDPSVGDLGEVTVDVIGLGDDAVGGERLHLFATPVAGGRFTLRTVEATTLCSRGVTSDLLCV